MVLDYGEFNDMAQQSDESLSWWFEKFKGLGVEYVGLQEENLESLIMDNEELEVVMGWEIKQVSNWKEIYPSGLVDYAEGGKIDEFDLMILTQSQDVYNFIYEGLISRYKPDRFEILSNEKDYAILLKGTINDALYKNDFKVEDMNGKLYMPRQKPFSSKLMQVGFGFDENKIDLIQASGLRVLPRPYTYKEWTDTNYMERTFNDLEHYGMEPPVFIFSGGEVLGYPDELDLLTKYMLARDIKAGLIENSVQRSHIEQEGLHLLARSLDYRAVRVFSIWPYIQQRFGYFNYEGAEEIENALYRAVTERNVRFIFFKPFKTDGLTTRYNKFNYITDYKEYENLFKRFETRIARHGMTLGRSSSLPPLRVRISKQILMSGGIIAAAILLLDSLVRISKKVQYSALAGGILFAGVGFVVRPMLMDKIMALIASIVFPSLAMVYFCKKTYEYLYGGKEKKKLSQQILYASRDLILISSISLLGGLFIAGLLSNIEYLLEMDIFRGVKLSQMLPMMIFVIIYFAYFGYRKTIQANQKPGLKFDDIKDFLFEDIKIIYVIMAMVLAGVGFIYMARTGHESKIIQPSSIELIARNMLEENLLARPRNKEFLIAFPALMLGIYFARNKIKDLIFISGLAAIIGQTSIANTFSHLRTPVYLSVIRTLYSLIFAIVLGAVYIILFEIGIRLFRRIRAKYLTQEKTS